MKTARGMVRPWTKHGRSLMASTDGLCLLQRLGQSLQNLRWPRDGTPDDNVFTRLLNLIYEMWFSTQLAWKGLWKVAQGLTDLTSARYVKWVGAVHIKAFKPMLSDIATVPLCTRVPLLESRFFFPPGCQEPKTSRCVSRLWWETEDHLIFSMVWSNVLWSWGVPDCYKPMIFKNGIRKPFPRPTKKVKAPVASFR